MIPPRQCKGGSAYRAVFGSRRGFTLIELMVVIAVIGVLAALVAPNVFGNLGAAKSSAAASQIAMLGAALDNYRLDTGAYPSTDQGLRALREAPEGATGWQGPYLRRTVPDDPWGRPYRYRFPAEEVPGGYALATLGADGEEGGEGEDSDLRGWD